MGNWVTQAVKHPSLDLRVVSSNPALGSTLGGAYLKKKNHKVLRGAWVAQLVKCPTLDFCSGHDLTVGGIEPHDGLCADSAEPAWDSLSPFISAPPPFPLALSLSQNK